MKRIVLLLVLAASTCLGQSSQLEFSGDSAYAALRVLASEIGPRPMGSPAEQRALAFAVAEFSRYGCDTSYIMPITDAEGVNTRSGVAVGIHRGSTGRIIVIGGHIDSAGPEIPGANDDGSGTAAVIELARVFANRDTRSTLVFCCWGGEEEGLRGSTYFADHFPAIDSVDLMLQIDMADGAGSLEADPDAPSQRSAPSWLVDAAFDIFYNELPFEGLRYPTHWATLNYSQRSGNGSDHIPFLQKGIPAIDFTSDISYPIHTPLDDLARFDPSGLSRSGLLVQKLAERFDAGTPSRETEQYWLLNIGRILLYVPYGVLQFVVGLAIVLGAVALFAQWWMRRRTVVQPSPAGESATGTMQMTRSETPEAGVRAVRTDEPTPVAAERVTRSVSFPPGERIHWSGLKLLVVTVFVQAFIWLSSTLVGTVAGVRFPWVNNVQGFVLLGLVAGLLGAWFGLHFLTRFRIGSNPLPLYVRAILLLLLYTVALSFVDTEVAFYPTVSLMLVALAALIRPLWLKGILVVLAPVMLFRLVFSEAFGFLLRMMSLATRPGVTNRTLMDIFLILLCTILSLPFVYALAAVYRESPGWPGIVRQLRSWFAFGVLAAASVFLVFYLAGRPIYNEEWQRAVRVEQRYESGEDSSSVTITGGEYLDGLRLTLDGKDTLLDGKLQSLSIPLPEKVNWCDFSASQEETPSGGGGGSEVSLNRTLTLRSRIRPLSVAVTYHSNGSVNVASPWVTGRRGRMARMSDTLQSFTWYSFPDSILVIPVAFRLHGNQTVQEEVEVVYDTLSAPLAPSRPFTFVIRRTVVRHNASFQTRGAGDQLAAGGR